MRNKKFLEIIEKILLFFSLFFTFLLTLQSRWKCKHVKVDREMLCACR